MTSTKRDRAENGGLAYIRVTYGVPAGRGVRVVTEDGKHGRIVGAKGPNLRVRLFGEDGHPGLYHPKSLTYEGMQGIEPLDAAALDRIPGRPMNGDAYSATCRPGSWEWQTAYGHDLRAWLQAHGYRPVRDPEATWRVRWTKAPPPEAAHVCPVIGCALVAGHPTDHPGVAAHPGVDAKLPADLADWRIAQEAP
jgi:hypothetical protein